MPLYEYKAYDSAGKFKTGLVDAPSQASAYGKLKKQGIFPTELSEETGQTYRVRVSTADLIFSLEQLSTLLKAGLPLPESLDTLVQQVANEELRRAFARVKVHLEEGESFASSLAYEQVFPVILVKMIEAGESVGAVEMILERFADFLEKESAFKEKVVSSLTYPAIVITASFGLIFFILTYIAPTLVQVFSSFHAEMPLPTQILLAVGGFLKNNSIFIFIFIGGAALVYVRVIPRNVKDNFMMKMPMFGKIHVYVQMSRWARTLSMLHAGGVTLIKALSSAREVVDNKVMSEELKNIEEYVQKGEGLGSAMSRIKTMPSLMVQMTKTGEKSGELERLLNTAATFYEKDVDKKLSLFFKLMEPAIIVFLSVTVGFVIVAALLPILQINKMIK